MSKVVAMRLGIAQLNEEVVKNAILARMTLK
jgi:hypothetical protein